jgi:hypothetical protein
MFDRLGDESPLPNLMEVKGWMAESYEGLQSYAQAIKGDEAFAERTMREAGRSKSRVRVLRKRRSYRVWPAVSA